MYIRVNQRDNVGIIVDPDGVGAGKVLPGGITAREAIPQGHKVALGDLEAGETVLRYGHPIGFAERAIPAGAWVREEMIRMPAPPALDDLPLSTAVPPRPVPLEGYTFEGYRNTDGGVGTRNILGIATTVQCVAPTVEYAAHQDRAVAALPERR
jgi:galactarate dehydratase